MKFIKYSIIAVLMIWSSYAYAQLSIQGKLRTLRPVILQVADLNGNVLLKTNVANGTDFKSAQVEIATDLYRLKLGDFETEMILANGPVTIKGFLDDRNPGRNTLSFSGTEQNDKFVQLSAAFKESRDTGTLKEATLDSEVAPEVIAAVVYKASDILGYEIDAFRDALSLIPEAHRSSQIVVRLIEEIKKREIYAVGAKAYPFNYPDPSGKMHSSDEFRGKLLLLDFWASWCGPCKNEMKNLVPIYEEFKDVIEFVSISLDDKHKNWIRVVEEDAHPWIMLWNGEGFSYDRGKPNEMQANYGFYSIPFIMLIDAEGRILARGIRGEQVREEIIKAKGNK